MVASDFPIGVFTKVNNEYVFALRCTTLNAIKTTVLKSDLTFTVFSKEEGLKSPLYYKFVVSKKLDVVQKPNFVLFKNKINKGKKATRIYSVYDDRFCRVSVMEYGNTKDFVFVLKDSVALKKQGLDNVIE